MSKSQKSYIKLIIICLIVAGLYFMVTSITSLTVFPTKIQSGQEYINSVKKYGIPKILKHTKLKLIKRGATIIPGKNCRKNIYSLDAKKIERYTKFFNRKLLNFEASELQTTPLDKDLQEGIINKIFSKFQNYVVKLEDEVVNDCYNDNPKHNTINNLKTSNMKSKLARSHNIQNNKAKYFRADIYKSNILARFKIKNRYLIVCLEEKYYKCSFPTKKQFFTYTRTNNYSILYYPNGITESKFQKYLAKKRSSNHKFTYFWDWKAKRSKTTWQKFYRLYKFTIPTSTTAQLVNGKIIFYGKNIHKKSKLLKIVQKLL